VDFRRAFLVHTRSLSFARPAHHTLSPHRVAILPIAPDGFASGAFPMVSLCRALYRALGLGWGKAMRWWLLAFALVLWTASGSGCAPGADNYPSRPITIVMGISKGGVTDVITRLYADAVSKRLGQPVLIDNRPSDTAEEAAVFVQHARPDGYTLLVFS